MGCIKGVGLREGRQRGPGCIHTAGSHRGDGFERHPFPPKSPEVPLEANIGLQPISWVGDTEASITQARYLTYEALTGPNVLARSPQAKVARRAPAQSWSSRSSLTALSLRILG